MGKIEKLKNECFENFKEKFLEKTKFCKKKYSNYEIKNIFEEFLENEKNAIDYDNDKKFYKDLNLKIKDINNILPKDEYGIDEIYRYFYAEFYWDITDEQITENFSDKQKEKYIDEKVKEYKYFKFENDGRFDNYTLSNFVIFFWTYFFKEG